MKDVINLEIVDSTSLYIKNNFKSLNNLSFVFSNYQTNGKGRGNNKWFSSNGENLLFSFLITEQQMINNYRKLSLSSAVIIAKILKDYGLKPKIKWPNDIFVNDGKICGILLETHMNMDKIDGIIVGIGLNVNQMSFDIESRYPITSLKKESKKDIDIVDLKKRIVNQFRNELNNLVMSHESIDYVNKNNYLKNKKCQLLINDNLVDIQVIKINKDCSLMVKNNNRVENIISGEIIFN